MILRHTHLLYVLSLVLLLCVTPPASATPNLIYTRSIDASRRKASSGAEERKNDYVAHPAHDLLCRPFGECEPCPLDERDQPFCLPFGNRRLLHCQSPDAQGKGEVPAWEACGKVVRKERRDFYEFVTCNLLFLIVALTILWARSSALASAQYRQLAARIGIPGGSWRA